MNQFGMQQNVAAMQAQQAGMFGMQGVNVPGGVQAQLQALQAMQGMQGMQGMGMLQNMQGGGKGGGGGAPQLGGQFPVGFGNGAAGELGPAGTMGAMGAMGPMHRPLTKRSNVHFGAYSLLECFQMFCDPATALITDPQLRALLANFSTDPTAIRDPVHRMSLDPAAAAAQSPTALGGGGGADGGGGGVAGGGQGGCGCGCGGQGGGGQGGGGGNGEGEPGVGEAGTDPVTLAASEDMSTVPAQMFKTGCHKTATSVPFSEFAKYFQICERCTAMHASEAAQHAQLLAVEQLRMPVIVRKMPTCFAGQSVSACKHFRWLWCRNIPGNKKCQGSNRHEKCPK
jgi:hypothetical protein